MKSSLCLINKKQTASFGIAGLMLTMTSLGLMLALANRSAQAQASASVSSATTNVASSPGDWTQFHFDNMQRWNPNETVLGVGNVGSLKLKWTNPIDPIEEIGGVVPSLRTSPAVANGVVYVDSNDSNLYALNASTSAKLWSFGAGGVVSSPAVANGVVYVGSEDGNLYALNAGTGAKLWSFATGDFVGSSPAVANGVVYFGSFDDNVYAINASTGAKLWSFATGAFVSSAPAVANGMVYVSSLDGNLYALNASTGAKLWSFTAGNQRLSSPAVANGVVYVGSDDFNLYALNANTGAKLWSFATGGLVESSPSVENGAVYIGSWDFNLYALNASTGAKLWSYKTAGPVYTSSAVANGVVYVASGDKGTEYALNASTGAKLWSYDTSPGANYSTTLSDPIVVNGVVYSNASFAIALDAFDFSGDSVFAFSVGDDLFLRVQPSTTTVHQGDLLTYAFPVWNLGPENAVREVLNTQVPVGTTFDYVRISGTPGLGTCTTPKFQGTGQIICHENSSMKPNSTWTVRLTVKVTAPKGKVITENAATLADTLDPNPANNTATVSVKVQ